MKILAAPFSAAAYGGFAFLVFSLAIVYCPGFLGGFPVPHSAFDGPLVAWPLALAVDLGLLALFGLHHSLFARQRIKRRLVRLVPESVERSTYVLAASLLLVAVYAFWRPLPEVLWTHRGPWRVAAEVAMAAGWLTSLASAHCLGYAELFGLRRSEPPLHTDRLHGVVRHPMYLGFLVGVWCVPAMSLGHLVFAGGMTAYLAVGVVFEERDLERRFGDAYRAYRARVPSLVPGLHLRGLYLRGRSVAGG